MSEKIDAFTLRQRSLCKPFGEFDEQAPVGRGFDFSQCNDETQTLNDVQIDLIILKQLQQLITGMIGVVRAHGKGSDKRPARTISNSWRSISRRQSKNLAS